MQTLTRFLLTIIFFALLVLIFTNCAGVRKLQSDWHKAPLVKTIPYFVPYTPFYNSAIQRSFKPKHQYYASPYTKDN